MPKIHNPDWNSLKLADFPQFKCLCELCDCGCFERSKKKHTDVCKRRVTKISNAFDSAIVGDVPPFDGSTLYNQTYKQFFFENTPSIASNGSLGSANSVNSHTLRVPMKFGPKDGSIELPDSNVKMLTNTTNKDHFKSWNSAPAKTIPEYPEFAGSLMYPNERRQHLTTNEEMFFKNYGKFSAKSSSLNIFENQFKINQGRNMDLNTVYTKDFHKLNLKKVLRERGPTVTKEMVEKRNSKTLKSRIPMLTETQAMSDYKYDVDAIRSQPPKQLQHQQYQQQHNLFNSKLTKGLKPVEDDYYYVNDDKASTNYYKVNKSTNGEGLYDSLYDTNYQLSYRDKTAESNLENNSTHSLNAKYGDSHLTHNKNIRFLASFDSSYIPSLKVISSLPTRKSSKIPQIPQSLSLNFDDDPNTASTYKEDFRDRGFDVCMAKAYSVLANKSSSSVLNQSVS